MIKIAVTGPESTGKSMLSEALARELKGLLVPEFAREYLEKMPLPYSREDVIAIAHAQHENIQKALKENHPAVISDTELLVISVWLNHKYGNSDLWVEEQIKQQQFDIYLLCDVDLPWQEDPLREHPHLREHFLNIYKSRLDELGFHYHVVSGTGTTRVQNALDAIRGICK